MTKISISRADATDGWMMTVRVAEGSSATEHRVGLSRDYHVKLTQGCATPEQLAEASFRFLLEREPKESILRSFEMPVIAHYFPEYERRIGDYLPE
ncbi:MAG: hypothetical protein MK220_04180 [Candidatus Poseidoniia archaeon]|nr:hypothetical protein [Candidatus Poseidoniia archaeon]